MTRQERHGIHSNAHPHPRTSCPPVATMERRVARRPPSPSPRKRLTESHRALVGVNGASRRQFEAVKDVEQIAIGGANLRQPDEPVGVQVGAGGAARRTGRGSRSKGLECEHTRSTPSTHTHTMNTRTMSTRNEQAQSKRTKDTHKQRAAGYERGPENKMLTGKSHSSTKTSNINHNNGHTAGTANEEHTHWHNH